MAKNKWRVREFKPTDNMNGRSHSFYAEAVINSDIDNHELSAKIAARTGFKSYEVQAVVAAIADIVSEEVLESNRINLSDDRGTKMVSIYPKVSGSVSDADILRETTAAHAQDASIPVRSVAVESDLTADRLTWALGASVGIKFSKQFAMQKQAQKVNFVATDTVIPNDDEPETGGTTPANPGGGGTTPVTPGGGGGDDEGGSDIG